MATDLYVIEMRDSAIWKTTTWSFHSEKLAEKKAEELRLEGIAKEIRVRPYRSIDK